MWQPTLKARNSGTVDVQHVWQPALLNAVLGGMAGSAYLWTGEERKKANFIYLSNKAPVVAQKKDVKPVQRKIHSVCTPLLGENFSADMSGDTGEEKNFTTPS